MRIGVNLSKQIKTAFEDQMEECENTYDEFDLLESYHDENEQLVKFLSILMLLNDIFIRFQEI